MVALAALASLVSTLAAIGVDVLIIVGLVAILAGAVVYGLVRFLRGMFAGEDGDEED